MQCLGCLGHGRYLWCLLWLSVASKFGPYRANARIDPDISTGYPQVLCKLCSYSTHSNTSSIDKPLLRSKSWLINFEMIFCSKDLLLKTLDTISLKKSWRLRRMPLSNAASSWPTSDFMANQVRIDSKILPDSYDSRNFFQRRLMRLPQLESIAWPGPRRFDLAPKRWLTLSRASWLIPTALQFKVTYSKEPATST